MKDMYKGKINSPSTTLAYSIDDSDTTIEVDDISVFPDPPNIAVIGMDEDAETIKYGDIDGNELIDVERAFQGTAKVWNSGTPIARLFTEYDYNALKENIETLAESEVSIQNIGIGEKLYKEDEGHKIKTIKGAEGIEVGWTERQGAWRPDGMVYSGHKKQFLSSLNMVFADNGRRLYMAKSGAINNYYISPAWDIQEASSPVTESTTGEMRYFTISNDGYHLFFVTWRGVVWHYNLSEPWQLNTKDAGEQITGISFFTGNTGYMNFNADGTKFYITNESNKIDMYTLSTAWDLTSRGNSFGDSISSTGFCFSPDGNFLYSLNTTDKKVYRYALSTPWDITMIISSIFFDYTNDISDTPNSMWIKEDDGMQMYIMAGTSTSAYIYVFNAQTDDVWVSDTTNTDTIEIRATPITNDLSSGEYSGQTTIGKVGESVSFGDLLYFDFTSKDWKLAKADSSSTMPCTAIALEEKDDGDCKLLRYGYVMNEDWAFMSSIVYVSPTDEGDVVDSVPDQSGNQIQRIGIAEDESLLWFNPSLDITEA